MKKNKGLSILLGVFIILTIVLGGYIFYDKVWKEKNSNEIQVEQTNQNNDSFNDKEESKVQKLEENKEWIYDAEYEKNVESNAYTTFFNDTYYAKNIVVPFINIDSIDGRLANNEIKKIFDLAIQTFNKGVDDKTTYVDTCDYEKNIEEEILSVLLTYSVGGTDVVKDEYYTYNLNLKTGNKLSYEEVYKLAGINSNEIDSKVEKAITKTMQEKMKDFSFPDDYPEGTNFDTYSNESINNYKESLSKNELNYFLTEDKKLKIVVKLHIPAGAEEFNTLITID